MIEIEKSLISEIEKRIENYSVCGFVDHLGTVFPLGSDTKVLSTVFELVSRPAVYSVASRFGYDVVEPEKQNHYPDFTFHRDPADDDKIAVDVKTTYRGNNASKFRYTLGSYTSFMRDVNGRKNIVFPFGKYIRHIVIGFVYNRVSQEKTAALRSYRIDELIDIPLPFSNLKFFVKEKWRIAGDHAGSGNTTNIGSINGTLADFREGNGPFESEDEFLEYWRSYGRTAAERVDFSNIEEFRQLKRRKG